MNTIMIIILIVLVLSLLLLIYAMIYNRFQEYIIRINEVENGIDNKLRNKFDIINKAVNSMKNNIKNDKLIIEKIATVKDETLTNFELDRRLIEIGNEIYKTKEDNATIKSSKTFNKICSELKNIDDELTAYRDYYNDNITKFNKLVRMFPTNIISKISGFKEKTFYDGQKFNSSTPNELKL